MFTNRKVVLMCASCKSKSHIPSSPHWESTGTWLERGGEGREREKEGGEREEERGRRREGGGEREEERGRRGDRGEEERVMGHSGHGILH